MKLRIIKKLVVSAALTLAAVFTVWFGSAAAADFAAVAADGGDPVLFTVSDGVKPGDSAVLTGANLSGDVKVRYSPLAGGEEKELSANGDGFGTGLTFIFPYEEPAGAYKISVEKAGKRSDEIVMNAPRPLFVSAEAAYAGQQVCISGRNFLTSDYGVGTEAEAYARLRVKLTSKSLSYSLSEKNGGILTGIKTPSEKSATGDDILYTNPFKITFVIPETAAADDYSIRVSTDGAHFFGLPGEQKFSIAERKAQAWNQEVFGSDREHAVGNDPLSIGTYWAQNLNYGNVYTVAPNAFSSDYADLEKSAKALSNTIGAKMNEMTKDGGVIYFPEGRYYLTGLQVPDNVLLVGAGEDKTTICRVASKNGGSFINSYRYANIDGQSVTLSASNIGIAKLTITESELSGGYPDYYVNFPEGSKTVRDEYGVLRSPSQNKFLVNVKVDGYKNKATVESGARARVSVNVYKNCVLRNLDVDGGTCVSAESYSYITLENVKFKGNYKNCDTPALQSKYAFIENCRFDLNYSAHGPSVRSDCYIAHTLTEHTGDRERPTNDGEALLVEMPGGYIATGTVEEATDRTVTLAYKGTSKRNEGEKVSLSGIVKGDSVARYNNFAVYIVSGTGTGQLRYIDVAPAFEDDGNFIYIYHLAPYEKDWDVRPDRTSVFTIIAPIKNLTVYKYKAYDCVGTICLYGCNFDTVVSDCTLTDTAGIYLYESNLGLTSGRHTPNANILIRRNKVTGVGANYNKGSEKAQGCGGLFVDTQRSANDMLGAGNMGVVIRENEFFDLFPETEPNHTHSWDYTGIVFATGGKTDNAQTFKGDLRHVIVEDNRLENSEKGIYVESHATDVVLRNNAISGIRYGKEADTGYADKQRIIASYTLVNGEETEIRDVVYGASLPTPEAFDGTFTGWKAENGLTYTQAFSYKPQRLVATFASGTKLKYASLTLDGIIGLNVGVIVSDDVLRDETTEAALTANGRRNELPLPEKNSDGVCVFRIPFAPKDFRKAAEIEISSRGETRVKASFSVREYVEAVLSQPEAYREAYALIEALNTYCEAAEAYFGNAGVQPAEKGVDGLLADYGCKLPDTAEGIRPEYVSLVLEASVELKIYFKAGHAEAVACFADGKKIAAEKSGDSGYCFVRLKNISAENIGRKFKIKIDRTEFEISPLDYVKSVLDGDGDENLKNLLKALTLYHNEARRYFGGSR